MSEVPTRVNIKAPPEPPSTQSITIPTTSPFLIPDEDKETYCFNRRDFFDIIIGLIIAIGIIYFVMYNNRYGNMYLKGLGSGLFATGSSGNMAPPVAKPVTATGLGSGTEQLGGYLKRLFK